MTAECSGPILVLANPFSGRGQGQAAVARLEEIFSRMGVAAEVRLPAGRDAVRAAVVEHAGNCRAVVAMGGDGTINLVASALIEAGSPCPLGIIPLGLSNCLAVHYRLPRDIEQAARVVVHGRPVRADAARADGRLVLAFLGAGLDAAVVARVAARRTGAISDWNYARAAFEAAAGEGLRPLRVVLDGRPAPWPVNQIIVSPIDNYAHYFHLSRSGKFTAFLFKGTGLAAMARTLWRMGASRDLERAADLVAPVRGRLEISSEEGRGAWQFDGEAGGSLPVACELLPGAIEVLTPR